MHFSNFSPVLGVRFQSIFIKEFEKEYYTSCFQFKTKTLRLISELKLKLKNKNIQSNN